MNPIDVMKAAYEENYEGSMAELIGEVNTPEVASTPEQQQVGLSEGPPRTMEFPDAGGKSFNTTDMKYPIDMQGIDTSGDVVQSYESVQPGVGSIPFGPNVDKVIESPSEYQNGGRVPRYQVGGYPDADFNIDFSALSNPTARVDNTRVPITQLGDTTELDPNFQVPDRFKVAPHTAAGQTLREPVSFIEKLSRGFTDAGTQAIALGTKGRASTQEERDANA